LLCVRTGLVGRDHAEIIRNGALRLRQPNRQQNTSRAVSQNVLLGL